jgi:APA family basic amino acid/polyamine antiporter
MWISPAYLPTGLQDLAGNDLYKAGWHFGFNIPAFLVVMILTVILVRGIRESARTNNVLVLVKIAAILVFICAAGASFIKPHYWHPFMPNGWTGVLTGGSIIFFTYIGFDSVSTAAEECKNPQRDLPIGILATLVACTMLYGGVAIVLSGIVPWQSVMGDAAPVVNALKRLSLLPGGGRLHWVRLFVLIGAMMGMISSILVFQLGQARVWFAMSRDGLLPTIFSRIHPQFRTPAFATWVAGFVVGHSGRAARYRHGFEPVEHWHAVRLCPGFDRGAHPALSRAGTAAQFPRSASGRCFPCSASSSASC